jgi:hypothetical protein
MMPHGYKVQEGSVYIFCEESKVGNWIVSNVLLVVGGSWLFLGILNVLVAGGAFLWRILMIGPFFLVPAFLFRILWRNMCGRIEFDAATEKIKFFRFYKEVVEAPVRSVEFRFTWILTCLYAGEKFTIPGGYINSIAEVLPEGVEIKFLDGFWGQLGKRQFEKRKRAKGSGK